MSDNKLLFNSVKSFSEDVFPELVFSSVSFAFYFFYEPVVVGVQYQDLLLLVEDKVASFHPVVYGLTGDP